MVWMQLLALPQLSVAVQVRVMTTAHGLELLVASAKVITGAGSQLSVAVAVPVVAGVDASSQFMVRSTGHVITGTVISWTVMV